MYYSFLSSFSLIPWIPPHTSLYIPLHPALDFLVPLKTKQNPTPHHLNQINPPFWANTRLIFFFASLLQRAWAMAPPNLGTEPTKAAMDIVGKVMGQPRRAYVTFLAGNGDYIKGVVGLAKGLRKVRSAYPLVVAVLPDVPEEHRRILVSQGCIVREIEPVYPPENQTQFAMAYYVINYSKLRIWEVI